MHPHLLLLCLWLGVDNGRHSRGHRARTGDMDLAAWHTHKERPGHTVFLLWPCLLLHQGGVRVLLLFLILITRATGDLATLRRVCRSKDHTHIHTHPHSHPHIHTHIHTHPHSHPHTPTLTPHIHTHIHTHHTHTHTHIHIHTHPHSHSHPHSHPHIHTHTHTHHFLLSP